MWSTLVHDRKTFALLLDPGRPPPDVLVADPIAMIVDLEVSIRARQIKQGLFQSIPCLSSAATAPRILWHKANR